MANPLRKAQRVYPDTPDSRLTAWMVTIATTSNQKLGDFPAALQAALLRRGCAEKPTLLSGCVKDMLFTPRFHEVPHDPLSRRKALAHAALAATAWTALTPAAWAQASATAARPTAPKAPKLAGTLRIVIPANPGGGWDQTGRALGAALAAVGAADQIEYENIGGKGGTIGLAKYAEKYGNDPNTLLMGGMVMVGAVALQKPAVDMSHIQPIARLTSDYLVAAVAAKSPIKNTKDLADAMRADLRALPVAGARPAGWTTSSPGSWPVPPRPSRKTWSTNHSPVALRWWTPWCRATRRWGCRATANSVMR